jgi:tetratricopeptide (TPR) repeat protein
MKYGALSACAAAGTALVAVGALQVSALFYDRAGLAAVDTDPAAATAIFERAARLWPGTILYDKHIAVAAARSGLRMSAGTALPTSRDFGLFMFQQAGGAINRVARLEPHAVSTQLLKLEVNTAMAEAGVPDANGPAEEALFALSLFRRTRPDVLYFEARLRFVQGDMRAARAALSQALSLKPDYAEARAFLAALEDR